MVETPAKAIEPPDENSVTLAPPCRGKHRVELWAAGRAATDAPIDVLRGDCPTPRLGEAPQFVELIAAVLV